jgi:hypothetical protein
MTRTRRVAAPHVSAFLGAAILLRPVASPSALHAQFFRFGTTNVRLGDGLPDRPGGFTFCRLAYYSVRREASGTGWDTDFPDAERNLSTRLAELTPITPSAWSHGEPGFAVVTATDPDLYQCPFLFTFDAGTMGLDAEEVTRLRDYLLKGGFFWVDDFWGDAAWNQWAREIGRVLPEYPIVDLPLDHPLFEIVYFVPRIPQIPSIRHWRSSAGGTSERGQETATPHIRAILNDEGRIMVLMSHNTDIADGWEREAEDPNFFQLFSPDAYAVGINILVWMMTH